MNEIERLKEGNKRYVEKHPKEKNLSLREELKTHQKPFATVITCSDSRVIPEYIFDAEIGELFVIRIAGNVLDDVALASVEYGVEHLHTPLLVVLGHESCGAVTAAFNTYKESKEAEGVMKELMEKIKPAVIKALNEQKGIEEAIEFNVSNVIEDLRTRLPVIKRLEDEKKLKVVGAKYFFDGHVEFYEG